MGKTAFFKFVQVMQDSQERIYALNLLLEFSSDLAQKLF
jgi:hypothetical protein